MNKKTQIRKRRDERIFSDYKKMYLVDMLQITAIYAKLSNKYYLDPDTIARIVYKKRKELRDSIKPPQLTTN